MRWENVDKISSAFKIWFWFVIVVSGVNDNCNFVDKWWRWVGLNNNHLFQTKETISFL